MQRTLTLSTETGYTLFVGPRGSGVTTAALKLATLTQPRFMIVAPTAAACRWAQCIVRQLVWHPGCEKPFGPCEQLVVISEAHEFTQEQIDPILKLCAAHNVDVWLEGHTPTDEKAVWWADLVNTGRPVGGSPRVAELSVDLLGIATIVEPWLREGERVVDAVRRLSAGYEDLARRLPNSEVVS